MIALNRFYTRSIYCG